MPIPDVPPLSYNWSTNRVLRLFRQCCLIPLRVDHLVKILFSSFWSKFFTLKLCSSKWWSCLKSYNSRMHDFPINSRILAILLYLGHRECKNLSTFVSLNWMLHLNIVQVQNAKNKPPDCLSYLLQRSLWVWSSNEFIVRSLHSLFLSPCTS